MENQVTVCREKAASDPPLAKAGRIYKYTSTAKIDSYWICISRPGYQQHSFINLRGGTWFSGGPSNFVPSTLSLVPKGTCIQIVTGE